MVSGNIQSSGVRPTCFPNMIDVRMMLNQQADKVRMERGANIHKGCLALLIFGVDIGAFFDEEENRFPIIIVCC